MELETRQRFAELEAEVSGEKLVTRHMLKKLDHIEDMLTTVVRELSQIGSRLTLIEAQLEPMDARMARLVGDTMREVLATKKEPKA